MFHGNSNPGTNPGIPGFVFHNPEIPGLEKGSGIASPSPEPMGAYFMKMFPNSGSVFYG